MFAHFGSFPCGCYYSVPEPPHQPDNDEDEYCCQQPIPPEPDSRSPTSPSSTDCVDLSKTATGEKTAVTAWNVGGHHLMGAFSEAQRLPSSRPFESSVAGAPTLAPSAVNCTVPVGTPPAACHASHPCGERHESSTLGRILVVVYRRRRQALLDLLSQQIRLREATLTRDCHIENAVGVPVLADDGRQDFLRDRGIERLTGWLSGIPHGGFSIGQLRIVNVSVEGTRA